MDRLGVNGGFLRDARNVFGFRFVMRWWWRWRIGGKLRFGGFGSRGGRATATLIEDLMCCLIRRYR